MSYDIDIINVKTGSIIQTDEPHFVRGGTFAVGGTTDLSLNVTYNYAKHFYRVLDEEQGIRWLYGKKVAETLPRLAKAVGQLGDDVHDDYWQPTEGNAKLALLHLIQLGAQAIRVMGRDAADAVWDGD